MNQKYLSEATQILHSPYLTATFVSSTDGNPERTVTITNLKCLLVIRLYMLSIPNAADSVWREL